MLRKVKPRRGNRRPLVERLEDRRLMAVTIADIPLASSTTQVNGVAAYPDGNIWFTASYPAELGVLHPATNFLVEFPLNITNSAPDAIAVGKDGNLYFTDPGVFGQSAIGVFNPATLKSFEVPTPTVGADPTSIAVANDGTVWFTETGVGLLGEFDPATQKITEFGLNGFGSGSNIQLGPDGNLWLEQFGNFLSFNPTTHVLKTLDTGFDQGPAGGFSFTPDGNIQYVAITSNEPGLGTYAAAQLNPSTGVITVSPNTVPFYHGLPIPTQLATGADGNVYYDQYPSRGTTVGEINVATQTISTYTGGTFNGSLPGSIAAGTDGNLYVGAVGAIAKATVVPPDVGAISGTVTVAAPVNLTGAAIAGRTVFVDLAGTGTFAPGDPSAVTDVNGNYTIPNVPLGTYTVDVVPYPGDFAFGKPVTLTGGNVTPNVSLSVQPTSAILPLNLSANPFGDSNTSLAESEVVGLYNIILGRAVDASGLVFYTTYLKNGGSLAVAAETMLHSAEYETDLVIADYRNFLGRTASSAEVAGWVTAMQHGLTAEQVAYFFLTSAEFNVLHPDNASFIQALYGDVLGRSASAAEVSSWQAYLSGASRASMVNFVIHSPEAGIRAAQGFYAEFWATPPDSTGEAAVVNALASGLTMADVASLFAASPQFIARAQSFAPLS